MNDKPLNTLLWKHEFRSRELDVYVTSGGDFTVTIDGGVVRAATFGELEDRVKTALKKAEKKLNIPIVVDCNGTLQRGVIYAVHAGTGAPLARLDDGGTIQIGFRSFYKPDMPDEAIDQVHADERESKRLSNSAAGIREKHRTSWEALRRQEGV